MKKLLSLSLIISLCYSAGLFAISQSDIDRWGRSATDYGKKGVDALSGLAINPAVKNLVKQVGLQASQVRTINNYLSDYLSNININSLAQLSRDQAHLIIAAFTKNISQMRELISRQVRFVNQSGVLAVLTALYNRRPATPALIMEFQNRLGL